jgi:hypothetical protein
VLAADFAALEAALEAALTLGVAIGVVSFTHSATPVLNSRNALSEADA